MDRLARTSRKKRWVLMASLPLLAAAVAMAALPKEGQVQNKAATVQAQSLSSAFRQAAKDVQPAVVLIKANPVMPVQWKGRGEDRQGNPMEKWFEGAPFGNMPELRRFFEEMPRTPHHEQAGIGSGVIIDSSGIILTNNHVVQGRKDIEVRLSDGREFKAEDVKTDPNTDLAVIRIKGAKNLTAARLGNSEQVEVGDWVLALGHPFGLEGTVTAGIVSAKGRGIGVPARASFIQTDAAINPGNSGGPLVNLDGEVIGINTAISSSSGGNQGIGFAVPVNLAKWVSGQLIDHGTVHRAQLGVMIQPVTQDLASKLGVDARQGVLVADVKADTPAAKAGLKSGDVIVEYAGEPVASPRELQSVVERSKIGTKHKIVIVRDGKRLTLEATPLEAPEVADNAGNGPATAEKHEPSRFEKLGIEVQPLTADVAKQLKADADHGVVITDVREGSPADEQGLASGMIILEAERQPVKSIAELRSALDKAGDKGVLLLVRTEQGTRFVVLKNTA